MTLQNRLVTLPRRTFVAGLVGSGLAQASWAKLTLPPELDDSLRVAAKRAVWGPARVRGGGWLEWHSPTALGALAKHAFDPAYFDVHCDFTGPAGRSVRVTGFWMRDANGSGWTLRFLPPSAGRWKATPQMRLSQSTPIPLGAPFEFDVDKVVPKQRVVIDPRAPRYFAFENGTPFVPMGLNVCWGASKTPVKDYQLWLTRLAENGGNFIRLWMASWSFGIEWKDGALGDYTARMEQAAQLDEVLEIAESLDIRVMLCLLNHGAYTEGSDSEWKDNPYNQANGGPLAGPEDFVSDPKAQALFERRLRYIAARWSHSPALHSWEWWNELTWTPITPEALRPWIHRMSAVLDAHDPYRRLRSTSWADRGDAATWKLPELDYVQQHDYTQNDLVAHYAKSLQDWSAEGVATKPMVPGELGLETRYDAGVKRPYNWDAVHLHNGLWAPLFLGYASTALYWWWDSMIDPQRMWSGYRGIARYVAAVHGAGLRLGDHVPHPSSVTGTDANALAMVGQGSALLWVRSKLLDVGQLRKLWESTTSGSDNAKDWVPPWTTAQVAHVRCAGLRWPDGEVKVTWFDPATGDQIVANRGQVRAGTMDLACPPFSRDLAAIVSAA
jgi:hypothetical protein